MSNIEIRFGTSWQHDETLVASLKEFNTINFSDIIDVIDIFIDGANISFRAPGDCIFLLLRDFISRIEELLTGKTTKVTIDFYESSWQIVLVLEGENTFLSFFSTGLSPYIEVKDRSVSTKSLLQSTIEAGENLLQTLTNINQSVVADPFISELMGGIERLKAIDLAPVISLQPSTLKSVTIKYTGEKNQHSPLRLKYEFKATKHDIFMKVKEARADLYSLMVRGHFSFELYQGVALKVDCYIYFLIEKLLYLVRNLISSVEQQRNMDVSFSIDGVEIEASYDQRLERLTLSIKERRKSSSPHIFSNLKPPALIKQIISAARHFTKTVMDINPSQKGNLKLEILNEEIETLSSWCKELEEKPVKRAEGSLLRYEVPAPASPVAKQRESKAPGIISRTKKLIYVQLWEAEIEGLKLEASYLCGDRIILEGKEEAFALTRDEGNLIWRTRLNEPEAMSIMVADNSILRFDSSGTIRLLDVEKGSLNWSTRITPPFGKPSAIVAGGGRRPRYAILTSGESTVAGVDLYTGELKWKLKTTRGTSYKFGKFGKLLFLTCNTNSIYCVDVDTGEILWKYSGRYKFAGQPVCFPKAVFAWGENWGERAGKIFLFEPVNGEEKWSASCEGWMISQPAYTDDILCIGFLYGNELILKAWDFSSGQLLWERDIGNFAKTYSWLPIDDRIVMNVAGGIVLCLKAKDGSILWSRNLAGSEGDIPLNLEPILRGGGLFVPADTTYIFSPHDGSLLHKLNEKSPVPDFLRVDENYSMYIGEVSGYFSAYGLTGHLGIVENNLK